MSTQTRIVDATVPSVKGAAISMKYTIERPKGAREHITLEGTVAIDTILLPDHKRDAIAFAGIIDAVQVVIGQAIRSDLAKHRNELSSWSKAVKAATDSGNAGKVLSLLKSKPEQPDLSDATAEFIGPFVRFLDSAKAAWASARKHTLAVYGSGKAKGDVVWTGTLSSLVGRKPAKGAIAFGRRVK